MSTHLLTHSVSRSLKQPPTDFSVEHVNNVDDFTPVSVQTVQMSTIHLFKNVYEPYNVLYVANTDTNVIEIVTIAPGQYNALQLQTALQNAFNLQLLWSTTVFISTVDFRMTVTPLVPTDPARYFLSKEELLDSTSFSNPLVNIPPQTLNDLVGTARTINNNVIFPGTMLNPVNLAGPQQVFVVSSALAHSSAMSSTQGHMDYVGVIDLTKTPYGSPVTSVITEGTHKSFVYKGDRSLSSLDIKLQDRFGTLLHLPENINVFVEALVHKRMAYH